MLNNVLLVVSLSVGIITTCNNLSCPTVFFDEISITSTIFIGTFKSFPVSSFLYGLSMSDSTVELPFKTSPIMKVNDDNSFEFPIAELPFKTVAIFFDQFP